MAHKSDKRSSCGAYVDRLMKSEQGFSKKQSLLLNQKNPRRDRLNKQAGDYLMKLARKKKISKIDINQAVEYLMNLVRLNRGT